MSTIHKIFVFVSVVRHIANSQREHMQDHATINCLSLNEDKEEMSWNSLPRVTHPNFRGSSAHLVIFQVPFTKAYVPIKAYSNAIEMSLMICSGCSRAQCGEFCYLWRKRFTCFCLSINFCSAILFF